MYFNINLCPIEEIESYIFMSSSIYNQFRRLIEITLISFKLALQVKFKDSVGPDQLASPEAS